MNYNFFADKEDKIEILKFIFNETDLHVYDLGSEYGKEICEYRSVDEICSKFDLETGRQFELTFQLWSPKFNGKPFFRRVDLDPKRCKGFTFRYATEGLGLIQLYFGGLLHNELNRSHIGHFSERGALNAENANIDFDKANSWDWIEIQKVSRKLKYQIHNKLAIKKIGSFGILEGANKLENAGIKLR